MYNDRIKRAIQKYREENTETYNEYQRNYYNSKKDDEVWKEAFRNKCREASRRYRAKKLDGAEPKPRGRPRKIPIIENAILENAILEDPPTLWGYIII